MKCVELAQMVSLLFVAGCAQTLVRLPYSSEHLQAREDPVHDKVLAVMVFEDGRRKEEQPAPDRRYLFRSTEYRGTALEDLGLSPMLEVSTALAQDLAKRRIFAKVLLVKSKSQAVGADYLLRGRLIRLRGYAEADTPPQSLGIAPGYRRVLAEVELDTSVLRQVDGAKVALFRTGWSFAQVRRSPKEGFNPWLLAAEALKPTFNQIADGLAESSLAYEQAGSASLNAATSTMAWSRIEQATPTGWRFVPQAVGPPIGWQTTEPCSRGHWRTPQQRGFHRRIGPYTPSVFVCACGPGAGLRWRDRAEENARFVGTDQAGRRWFVLERGGAFDDVEVKLQGLLQLQVPSSPYVFSLTATSAPNLQPKKKAATPKPSANPASAPSKKGFEKPWAAGRSE